MIKAGDTLLVSDSLKIDERTRWYRTIVVENADATSVIVRTPSRPRQMIRVRFERQAILKIGRIL